MCSNLLNFMIISIVILVSYAVSIKHCKILDVIFLGCIVVFNFPGRYYELYSGGFALDESRRMTPSRMCTQWPLLNCAFCNFMPVIGVEMDFVKQFPSIDIVHTVHSESVT